MAKVVLTLFLCSVLVSSVFVHDAEATEISNGAMNRNTISCSKKDSHSCQLPSANPYNRGCEASNSCRSPGSPS